MTYRIKVSLVEEQAETTQSLLPIKRVREVVKLSAERSERLQAIEWAASTLSDIGGLDRVQESTKDKIGPELTNVIATFICNEIQPFIASIVADPEGLWFNGNAQGEMRRIKEAISVVLKREGIVGTGQ